MNTPENRLIIDPTLKSLYLENRNTLALVSGEIITTDYTSLRLNAIQKYINKSETLVGGKFFGSNLPVKLTEQAVIDELIEPLLIIEHKNEAQKQNNSDVAERFMELQQKAVDKGCSDIHIELYENEVRFLARVDGRIVKLAPTYPEHQYGETLFAYAITALATQKEGDYVAKKINNGQIEQWLMCSDGQGGKTKRLTKWRFSYVDGQGGGKMVLRWTNDKVTVPRLEDMGFHAGHIHAFKDFIACPSGICFLTGQTGAGKSTSLASLLSMVDWTKSKRSIEDPVEFSLGFIQTLATEEQGYKELCKAFLRQDPDVVMLGEIREHAVAMEAARMGETGQLLLSTLHTSSATGIATTLMDQMKVSPSIVASPDLMRLWVYQTLVLTLCSHCKLDINDAKQVHDALGTTERFELQIEKENRLDIKNRNGFRYRNPCGCSHCDDGETGRTAVAEIIILDEEDRTYIKKNDIQGWQHALKAKGFKDVRDHAISKILTGLIDFDTAAGRITDLLPVDTSEKYKRMNFTEATNEPVKTE